MSAQEELIGPNTLIPEKLRAVADKRAKEVMETMMESLRRDPPTLQRSIFIAGGPKADDNKEEFVPAYEIAELAGILLSAKGFPNIFYGVLDPEDKVLRSVNIESPTDRQRAQFSDAVLTVQANIDHKETRRVAKKLTPMIVGKIRQMFDSGDKKAPTEVAFDIYTRGKPGRLRNADKHSGYAPARAIAEQILTELDEHYVNSDIKFGYQLIDMVEDSKTFLRMHFTRSLNTDFDASTAVRPATPSPIEKEN